MATAADVLQQLVANGSSWIPEKDYRSRLDGSLRAVSPYVKCGKIIYCKKFWKGQRINVFTTASMAKAENEIAENVVRLLGAKKTIYPEFMIDALIKEAETMFRISLHEQQKEAVYTAVQNSFAIITGGPGTGKTCTLNVIRYVLSKLHPDWKIAFTAPTGKAASRITESTGSTASTLHKKLGITKEKIIPCDVNEDVLIVDESSMLDTIIAAALLKSIRTGHKLLLVGDIDQLPSVGPGAVLRDLIASGVVPVARLIKTFRQAGDSFILDNSKKIRAGDTNILTADDFKIYDTNGFEETAQKMLELYLEQIKIWGIDNVVCLTPFRVKGAAGSNSMNRLIQEHVNPTSPDNPEIRSTHFAYRKNDLVMQLENRAECANGDVGKVVSIDTKRNTVTVKYVESTVTYKRSELNDQLSLAYAMSIHKSQGSEYDCVISCLCTEHGVMLRRNLFYTAVTRAKKVYLHCGDKNAMKSAIRSEESSQRITMLAEKLQYAWKNFHMRS